MCAHSSPPQQQPIHFAFLRHLMRQVSRKNVKNAFSRINKYWRVFVGSSPNDKMAILLLLAIY
jgi:hypothetical protein